MTANDPVPGTAREPLSLRVQVTDRLRAAILDGRYPSGARLIERDLCEQLGISRALLREALQHLDAEGLIRIVLHKGPTVARIDADEAREIYAVRQRLEALAGEGFARSASPEDRLRLRAAFERLKQPRLARDMAALLEVKNAFYAVLLGGCGNRLVAQLLTQLNNRVTLLRRFSLGEPHRLAQTLRELEAVVAAIEAGDAERAGSLCAEHVARAAAVVARQIEAAASPAAAAPSACARSARRRSDGA